MPRPNMKNLVEKSWKAAGISYPPAVGANVRLWDPMDARGKVAKVVANDTEAKKDAKIAPKGKIRVNLEGEVFPVSQNQAFPTSFTVKKIEAMLGE